jgi:hypothetical protein
MTAMPKQMVLQFKVDQHGSVADFDRLVAIEEALDSALQRNGTGHVDGHDMGSGEMNLFLVVKNWKQGEWFMLTYLKNQQWSHGAVLAKDNRDGTYAVIWPQEYEGTFSVT